MSDEPPFEEKQSSASAPYAVGFARPPKKHQFRKGSSGNPKGRPRKAAALDRDYFAAGKADFDETLLSMVREPVRVRNTDGQWTETTIMDGVLRQLGSTAVKGDKTVQLALARMASAAQRRTQKKREQVFIEAAKYKTDAFAEITKARSEGRPDPVFVPDPSDMAFDPYTSTVTINGPATHEEAATWKGALEMIADCNREIADMEAANPTGLGDDEDAQARIALLRKLIRRASILYPDEQTRRRPGFDLISWQKKQLGEKELRRLLRGE